RHDRRPRHDRARRLCRRCRSQRRSAAPRERAQRRAVRDEGRQRLQTVVNCDKLQLSRTGDRGSEGRTMRRFLIFVFVALAWNSFAQSTDCNLIAPAQIQPGQSVTLSYSVKNTGSTLTTTGSPSNDFFMTLSVDPVTNINAVFPPLHMSNVQINDPQLS